MIPLCTPAVDLVIKNDLGKSVFPELSATGTHVPLRGEHLLIHGDSVYWIRNGLTFRKLSYKDEKVIAAEFTYFEDSPNKAAVVVVGDMIYTYLDNGKAYTSNLPFLAQRVLPCERGLVIERALGNDDNSIPKFYTLRDPILEMGLVVSSSTSAISPQESLVYFKRQTCVTYNEGQVQIYHARYLARPKTSMKRHSRKKSSLLPRHDELGDQSIDQRLSFSRTETGALDRMSDIADDEVNQFGLNAVNLRKDVILTLLASIPVAAPLDGIKVGGVTSASGDAVAIVNRKLNMGTVVIINKVQSSHEVPTMGGSFELETSELGVMKRSSGEELFLLISHGEPKLMNPFLKVESPPISHPSYWGTSFEIISCEGDAVVLKGESGDQFQVRVALDPEDELVIHCFTLLAQIMSGEMVEELTFIWAAALVDDPQDEWGAFVVVMIAILGISEAISGELKELHERARKFELRCEHIENPQNVLVAFHILREENKLDISCATHVQRLGKFLSYATTAFRWPTKWRAYYFPDASSNVDGEEESVGAGPDIDPPNIYVTLNSCFTSSPVTMELISDLFEEVDNMELTPRLMVSLRLFSAMMDENWVDSPEELLERLGIDNLFILKYPEGIRVAILDYFIEQNSQHTQIYDVNDASEEPVSKKPDRDAPAGSSLINAKDMRSIVISLGENDNSSNPWQGGYEADRLGITRLIFDEDRRFYEVSNLLKSSRVQTATFGEHRDLSDHERVKLQEELYAICVHRLFSIPFGRALLYYSFREPQSTEKFTIPALHFQLELRPANITMVPQKNSLSEEMLQWGYFHNGVSAGLSISRSASISASWIIFNKPPTLTAQHAGFLLGMGMNGHLSQLEEWHIYNYLGPKHQFTSMGLLIGMAASMIGTCDIKLTKVLSVHTPALLPPGSNNLNVSTLVQTAGIIGIGLVYCESKHRRMSEFMLKEIAAADKDESYRLSAGISLGMINLGLGSKLTGLREIHFAERLLEIAVAPRDSQTTCQDASVPGALMALMFAYMKSGNVALVKKLELPTSEQMLDYIRADHMFLRVLARHLIMWDDIDCSLQWVKANITHRLFDENAPPNTDMLGYFYMVGALCLAVAVKYISSGSTEARNTVLHYHKQFYKLLTGPGSNNFDHLVFKKGISNVYNVLTLCLATIMSGTGDLTVFRILRRGYASTTQDTTYGSFIANQMAMGILFFGGGQYGFKQSNFAVASLITAFYPLFPTFATDNGSHLQSLRHFWVFAAESRILVARDSVTKRPVRVPILVHTVDSPEPIAATTPYLLPKLDSVTKVVTNSDKWYPVELNAGEEETFKGISFCVVERPQNEDMSQALTDESKKQAPIAHIEPFKQFNRSEVDKLLDATLSLEPTAVDAKLALRRMVLSPKSLDDLWNLRILFGYADTQLVTKYLSTSDIEELKLELWKYRERLALQP